MNWFNILLAGYEAKKQYVIITAIIVIVSSIGGYLVTTNNNSTPTESKEIIINLDAVKPEPTVDASKAANCRKGTFKESKKESF